jgi:hypothetical protein
MKKIRTFVMIALIAVMGVALTGCYGSFALTKKVYEFNGSMGNKFVNEAVFLAFCIIPVYEVSAFVDAIVLNLVEFWTGSNPLALHQGDNNINIKGKNVKVNLTGNLATIYDDMGKPIATVNYNESDNTWYSTINGNTSKLMSISSTNVMLYSPSGKVVNVPAADLHSASTLVQFNELTAMK